MTKEKISTSRSTGGHRWMTATIAAFLALTGAAACFSACGGEVDSEARTGGDERPARIEIVVHRGANYLAPENTLAAAQECVDRNADYVEVDVRTSKDGVLYVLHDRTLDRTTNGTGAIRERLSSYIDTLDAGSWFHAEFAGQKVPRLEAFLEEFQGRIGIYFDVKDANLKQLIELVYASGFERNSFFWFKDDGKARELRQLDASLRLKMTAQDMDRLNQVMTFEPQIIECRLEALTDEFVSFCKRRSLKIMVNTLKANSEEDYRTVLTSAADMVNLNDVALMMGLMDPLPTP